MKQVAGIIYLILTFSHTVKLAVHLENMYVQYIPLKPHLYIAKLVITGVNLFFFAPELVSYSAPRDLHRRAAYSICESWFLIHQDVYRDLFVCS